MSGFRVDEVRLFQTYLGNRSVNEMGCKLTADGVGVEYLHAFAKSLHIDRKRYFRDGNGYYLITSWQRKQAVRAGALERA